MASRAVPVPGPMADQAAMADPGIPAAMAERGAREASMVGSPPPKFSWGNSSQGGAQEAPSLGVLGSRT